MALMTLSRLHSQPTTDGDLYALVDGDAALIVVDVALRVAHHVAGRMSHRRRHHDVSRSAAAIILGLGTGGHYPVITDGPPSCAPAQKGDWFRIGLGGVQSTPERAPRAPMATPWAPPPQTRDS